MSAWEILVVEVVEYHLEELESLVGDLEAAVQSQPVTGGQQMDQALAATAVLDTG